MDCFVELCAGSAAVSFRLLGNDTWVSYAGSKAGYAERLIDIFGIRDKLIENVVLVDPGPWGITLNVLESKKKLQETAKCIESTLNDDPKNVWSNAREFIKNDKNTNTCELAANHLMCVAGTYGGCETGGFKGKHKHRPNVDGFIPSRNTIAKRLRETKPFDIQVFHCRADDIVPFPCYCYIDPPYQECSTKYVNEFKRKDVVKVALDWNNVGAKVVVSENTPITELIKVGWTSENITKSRKGQNRKNSKSREEYVTFNF